MQNQIPKIVVITPVKNEEWILTRFLSVTSQFADYIIVADQSSTDRSIEICKSFPKVTLVENTLEEYDEASRQVLLIQKARELVLGYKIILALDADEILAANATKTLGWQSMLSAKPGTILYFEKPDLYVTTDQCIRYTIPWPIGYVDDGAEHKPRKIHSIRIPMPQGAPRLKIYDVKFLHYGLVRLDAQASKMRMYCVVENLSKTLSPWLRRIAYLSNKDWTKQGRLETCPMEWFQKWEDFGIDMQTVICSDYYWYDYQVLQYFGQHGTYKFWFDDIWSFDWESCRLRAISLGIKNIPPSRILKPPKLLVLTLKILDKILLALRWISISARK